MTHIDPLTEWLRHHTTWALFFTFLISFAESLAILGSLIPGSLMMTLVGMLAGSGILRIDLTLAIATLGAILGDGGSYALGYILRDRLFSTWPFSRHPRWLAYGEDYFKRHGGKSIVLGRFIGPLRSLIPVIAGMLRMHYVAFFTANIISAICWSLVYVGPGILIGQASSDLSAHDASRLFFYLIGTLLSIWFIGLSIRWIWLHIKPILQHQLHLIWQQLMPFHFFRFITPQNEQNHARTAALVLFCSLGLMLSIALVLWIKTTTPLNILDTPLYFFLQTLRTTPFDYFFITMALLISPVPLFILISCLIIPKIILHKWRLIQYWTSLILVTLLLSYTLDCYLHLFLSTSTIDLLTNQSVTLYRPTGLTLATAVFTFLIFNMRMHLKTTLTQTIQIGLFSILILSGLALLYLGDTWFSNVVLSYILGATISTLHWIFYRRSQNTLPDRPIALALSCLCYLLAGLSVATVDFKSVVAAHEHHPQPQILSHHAWWSQEYAFMPRYATNRLGRPIGVFNIQYLGSIKAFQSALETHGWKKQTPSLLQHILAHTQPSSHYLIKPSFYLTQKPILTMTYSQQNQANTKPLLILTLWQSNYRLIHHHKPLWFGSIRPYNTKTISSHLNDTVTLHPLLTTFEHFQTNIIPFPTQSLESAPSSFSASSLLMIKEIP